jgi:hypothetical protein
MERLLILLLLPALAFAGCASPGESNDDADGTTDCPAANGTADANASNASAVEDSMMETDDCADVPAPESSAMCAEGAEDCEDTVNSTGG